MNETENVDAFCLSFGVSPISLGPLVVLTTPDPEIGNDLKYR